MVLFGSRDPDDKPVLFHYTGAEKLALILTSRRLWLSPYSAMRDPRENNTWRPSLGWRGSVDQDSFDVMALWEELDAAVRQRAKLACFTMDRPEHNNSFSGTSRGWARARMWEQYAERHRGAVLVFDHQKLDEVMTTQLDGRMHQGPVRYLDGHWTMEAFRHLMVEDLLERGCVAVADEIIEQHGDDLYFEKDIDWASEFEYRYVTVTEADHEEVEALPALEAIILGMDYPDHEVAVLRYRLSKCGLPDNFPVARCRWSNGHPILLPAFGP
jgi:hypothetical protein